MRYDIISICSIELFRSYFPTETNKQTIYVYVRPYKARSFFALSAQWSMRYIGIISIKRLKKRRPEGPFTGWLMINFLNDFPNYDTTWAHVHIFLCINICNMYIYTYICIYIRINYYIYALKMNVGLPTLEAWCTLVYIYIYIFALSITLINLLILVAIHVPKATCSSRWLSSA